jgi:hypothetical protein
MRRIAAVLAVAVSLAAPAAAGAVSQFRSVAHDVECRSEGSGILCATKHAFHVRRGIGGGNCLATRRVGSVEIAPVDSSWARDICGPITAQAPTLRTGFLQRHGAIGCLAWSPTAIECRSRASGYAFKLSARGFTRMRETTAVRLERNASEDTLLAEQRAEEDEEERRANEREDNPPQEEPNHCGSYLRALCE